MGSRCVHVTVIYTLGIIYMYSINMTGHIKCAPIFSCLPVACFDATLSGRGDYVDAIVAPGSSKCSCRLQIESFLPTFKTDPIVNTITVADEK